MNAEANDDARRTWARWTGFLLLLTNGTAMFAVWTRGGFIVRNDAALTAANITGSETVFRVGIAFELLTAAGVILLVAGLYIVLKPVNACLALLATLWRLVEVCVLVVITFASFTALSLLGGGDYMRALDPRQAQDLAYALSRVHGWGFQVAFLFLGLGQLAFSLLWWRSHYVPRWLAGLGVVGSAIMAAMALAILIWPPLYRVVTMAYMLPMGVHEIGLGLWLLVCGIRLPAEPISRS